MNKFHVSNVFSAKSSIILLSDLLFSPNISLSKEGKDLWLYSNLKLLSLMNGFQRRFLREFWGFVDIFLSQIWFSIPDFKSLSPTISLEYEDTILSYLCYATGHFWFRYDSTWMRGLDSSITWGFFLFQSLTFHVFGIIY